MRRNLLRVLHPAFDTLSAYADLSEIDGAKARVGRHVARCAECREVVQEIRGLGTAAREADIEGAPAGLWARLGPVVARAAAEDAAPRETPKPDAVPWDVAPSLRPTRHWPIPTRRSFVRIIGGVAVAAAALIAVALGTGRTPALLASSPSRMTMTPFRPAPGGTVHVRFAPPPRLAGSDELALMGQYLTDSRHSWKDYYFGGVYDSLATLHRASDGAMVGDFTVPADFKAASFVVFDPRVHRFEADGMYSWLLVGGDSRGRPALGSLLAALSLDGLYGSAARSSVLDTLQRYFPDHPAGYATAKRYRGEGVFADLLKFFKGAERKYVTFNSSLERLPAVDADRLAAMVDFGYEIQEPTEAAKWTRRLVREHPTDPRALPAYAHMVHELELKEFPRDSILPYIPLLDSLFELSSYSARPYRSGEYELVQRYGDVSMRRRWALRSLQRAPGPLLSLNIEEEWLRDREIRDVAAQALRTGLGAQCVPPRWLNRNWSSANRNEQYCQRLRASARASLSTIALLDGQSPHALALADSAIAQYAASGLCWTNSGHRSRGEALLALGDTTAAANEFALAFRQGTWQASEGHAAIVKRLGGSVPSGKWAAFDAEATAEVARCARAAGVRDSLEKLGR